MKAKTELVTIVLEDCFFLNISHIFSCRKATMGLRKLKGILPNSEGEEWEAIVGTGPMSGARRV